MDSDEKVSVSIGNIDAKIDMLQATFATCVDKYHEPLAFIAQVDATIQALRNFTFTIQNHKSSIKDFEKWYEPWQERLKKDLYLKWLHKTRTSVVHEDILTTTSNAVVTVLNSHAERLITKHFDIMEPTEKLIEYGTEMANETPALKHAMGIIERHYLFTVDDKEVAALEVLGAGLAAMRMIHIDLANYVRSKGTINGDLPDLSKIYDSPAEKLRVIFKLRDGSVLTDNSFSVSRRDLLKNSELAKKRYGSIKLKNRLDSDDKFIMLRGQFEIAKRVFDIDGHHLPMMQVKSQEAMSMIMPSYRDRAEKILFMENLAKIVKEKGITEIILTTESWTHDDPKRVIKQLDQGKELSALRKKGEILEISYLDNTGKILSLSAPIVRDQTTGKAALGEPEERVLTVGEYQIFNPVFYEWGLIDKIRVEEDEIYEQEENSK